MQEHSSTPTSQTTHLASYIALLHTYTPIPPLFPHQTQAHQPGGSGLHHLHGTAGQAKGHGPNRAGASPVHLQGQQHATRHGPGWCSSL